MQTILTAITNGGLIAVTGWVAAGGFAIAGWFDRQRRTRKIEDDQVATNLINNLQTTATVQAAEIIALRAKEVEAGKAIAHLEGQVKVLTDILQGRDPATQTVLNQIPEIHKATVHNGELTEKLTTVLTSFIQQLSVSLNK